MSYWESNDSYRRESPLFYLGNIPMNLTLTLIAAHISSMVIITFLVSFGMGSWASWMVYQSDNIINHRIFSVIAYPFAHNIANEGIFFALDMLFFWWFGKEVESYMGRTLYACLYAILTVLPPVVLSLLGLMGFPSGVILGSFILHLGVFVAFATLYPNAMMMFGLPAKGFAIILIGIYTLMGLYSRDWFFLAYMWITISFAFHTIRYAGIGETNLGLSDKLKQWKASIEEKKLEDRRRRLKARETKLHQDVDKILEKIAQQGISSLTPEEKHALEKARADLIRKDQNKRG